MIVQNHSIYSNENESPFDLILYCIAFPGYMCDVNVASPISHVMSTLYSCAAELKDAKNWGCEAG